jgi:hypothetical protein
MNAKLIFSLSWLAAVTVNRVASKRCSAAWWWRPWPWAHIDAVEAERHSATAATGAVAIGVAVTNSSLPVDLVLRSSTGIPLGVLYPYGYYGNQSAATATATKGTLLRQPRCGYGNGSQEMPLLRQPKCGHGHGNQRYRHGKQRQEQKGKYVSEADAIKQGDKPAPGSRLPKNRCRTSIGASARRFPNDQDLFALLPAESCRVWPGVSIDQTFLEEKG